MAIFYYINWIVAAETIEGGKLFKGENYSRKYGSFPGIDLRSVSPMTHKSHYLPHNLAKTATLTSKRSTVPPFIDAPEKYMLGNLRRQGLGVLPFFNKCVGIRLQHYSSSVAAQVARPHPASSA